MRSIWSGFVSFGLVTIPVKLYAAAEDARTPLHEVHTCGSRIRHRRVCEREQREVPQEEIRRGWEAPDGRVVVLDAGDLEHLPLPSKRTAEVLGFVDDGDVDPLLYDRPYWAGPNGDTAQRPYALLVEALARHGTIAVCKVAIRTRERLAILRPRHGMLVLHTLRWPEEIRDPGDLSSSAPVTDRELALAELLMDQLAGVDIGDLRDEYAVALEQLIVAKGSGRELEAGLEPEPVVDLMAALERSIRDARRE
ncbi:non-homologous end joining protein Ku [Actinacidiphila oryziradicis]|uniref:Non-homologous end joining protein Ku n=1 Tax=Actinacidiphila oryziradicis TaxID=2571141 RepID=A0A4U0RJ59_9ACTN|nr:Ku protein [Actinacidiphila oryziradicis]TJZ94750.1 Ku protein [Actinacidiphila oryziradicis]